MSPDAIHALGEEVRAMFALGWPYALGVAAFVLAYRWLGAPRGKK